MRATVMTVCAVSAFAGAVAAGQAVAAPDVTASPEYRALLDDLETAHLHARLAAQLSRGEASEAERADDISAREAAIVAMQAVIDDEYLADGLWVVGEDIAPGTYRTVESDGVGNTCAVTIYVGPDDAREASTDLELPLERSFGAGELVLLSGCGEWERVS